MLPRLIQSAKQGKKIRLWSAGCSSGQEPYSMALTILSLLPDARSHDIRILATDINPNVLAVGRKAVYREEEVADVPAELRNRWMEKFDQGGENLYHLDEAVTRMVSFRELNFIEPWPMRGTFQVIFCRNVVIYFDEKTQARIWSNMLPLLDRDGTLYIGHSERVNGAAAAHFTVDGTTTYRVKQRAAA